MAFDHGILNLPLDKRGGGSINSQLDRYKADLAKAKKAADKEAVVIRRSDKAIARDLFTQHAQTAAESIEARRGIPVSDSIKLMDSWAKWEPKKLIKLLEKYQADTKKNTGAGMATKRKTSYQRMAARVKALGVSKPLAKGATRRKNAGYGSIRRTKKELKSRFPDTNHTAGIKQRKSKTAFSGHGTRKKGIRRKRNAGSSFNLHSLLKWGIIAGVGYFLFTRFVKPNLSSALSGIVNDRQMSWNYVNPSRMLQAQIGNPMGQAFRNMPITMGRGVM